MTNFPLVPLSEIASVSAGDPAPQVPEAFSDDGPPFVRMQDVGRDHINPALDWTTDRLNPDWLRSNRLRLFPKGSLLVPKSGASVNLNHRAMLAVDAYVVSHLAVVTPKAGIVEPDFLFWWSVQYDPRAQVQVTSLPSLKASILKDALIPLPPIEEQRRIVDILNRAASIERLRATASAHLRDFVPALFIKMFGDPIENPMGWELKPLSELCSIKSELRTPDVASEAEELCVGPDSFDKDTGAWLARTTVGDVAPRSGKYWFEAGDVLYSKIRPALRKCVLADRHGYCSADVYPLRCNEIATPEYLHGLLLSRSFSDYAVGTSTRAQMPKINRKALFAYMAMCPPIELQRGFSQLVIAATERMRMAEGANQLSSDLSQSLLDKLLGTQEAPAK